MDKTRTFALLSALLFSISLFSQEVVYVKNRSFEDKPGHSSVPKGWYSFGFPGESPPDTQPGQFEVSTRPAAGKSFLGMVTRENETWESVGQQLDGELIAGQMYSFSVYLSRSDLYLSASKFTEDQTTNHSTPIKLRIWGGKERLKKSELLAESALVINTRWLQYDFEITPRQNMKYLFLEAFYKTPSLFLYNGNILVDNASHFIPIDSISKKALALPDSTYEEENEYSWEKETSLNIINKEYTVSYLKKYIKEHGDSIKFNSHENFLDEAELAVLKNIIKRMRLHADNHALIIAFHPEVENAAEKIKALQTAIMSQRLPFNAFTVREFHKKDNRRKWLSDNGLIRIRVKFIRG